MFGLQSTKEPWGEKATVGSQPRGLWSLPYKKIASNWKIKIQRYFLTAEEWPPRAEFSYILSSQYSLQKQTPYTSIHISSRLYGVWKPGQEPDYLFTQSHNAYTQKWSMQITEKGNMDRKLLNISQALDPPIKQRKERAPCWGLPDRGSVEFPVLQSETGDFCNASERKVSNGLPSSDA